MVSSSSSKAAEACANNRASLAQRIQRLNSSPLRDIFSAIGNDNVISFAGGLPSADTFPDVHSLSVNSSCLQYGLSEGEPALREHIAKILSDNGLKTSADRVLILSGSQQGVDLVAKLLIEQNTRVAVESPTYLAALQVFGLFGAQYSTFTPGEPSQAFASHSPSLLYTIPTFQNPSGYCYTAAQRAALAQLCDSHGTIVFEDDPYRDLAYDICDRTPVCAYLRKTDWIYQSSFSKTIAPGLRIGYLTCSESLFPHLLHLKQAADLHSCRLSQQVLMQLFLKQNAGERSKQIVKEYKKKRDFFNLILNRHFQDLADWQIPKGGLFYWLTLKPHLNLNTTSLFHQALEKGVSFLPSEYFYANEHVKDNSMRLNFSNASSEDVESGLTMLAELIRQHDKKHNSLQAI